MQNTRKCLFSTKIIQSILCWYVHKHNRTIEIQILYLLVLVDEDCLFLEEIYAQKYTASAYRHIPSAEQTPIRIIQSFTWSWLQNNKQRRSGRAEGSSSLLEAVLGCHWETRLLHPLPPSLTLSSVFSFSRLCRAFQMMKLFPWHQTLNLKHTYKQPRIVITMHHSIFILFFLGSVLDAARKAVWNLR